MNPFRRRVYPISGPFLSGGFFSRIIEFTSYRSRVYPILGLFPMRGFFRRIIDSLHIAAYRVCFLCGVFVSRIIDFNSHHSVVYIPLFVHEFQPFQRRVGFSILTLGKTGCNLPSSVVERLNPSEWVNNNNTHCMLQLGVPDRPRHSTNLLRFFSFAA